MEQIQIEELFSHRENFKAMITSHIETFDSGVYCISAKWGMGKTFLINKIIDEFPTGKKPLYFDAWKYDKYHDPLAALYMGLIVGEDNELIKNFKENSRIKITEIREELTRKTGMEFKIPVFSTGIATTSSVITNEETNVSQLVEKTFDINKCYYDLAEVLKDEGAVLIIDELDRANPHFTISMLEVVKHFFQEVSIYLVTDRVVLADIVNNYYGFKNGFDYLEKIVDNTFLLPEIPTDIEEKQAIIKKIINQSPNTILFSIIEDNLKHLSIRQLKRVEKESIPDYSNYHVFFGNTSQQRIAYIIDALLRIEMVKDYSSYYSFISEIKSVKADASYNMENKLIQNCKYIIKHKIGDLNSDEEIEENIEFVLPRVIEINNY